MSPILPGENALAIVAREYAAASPQGNTVTEDGNANGFKSVAYAMPKASKHVAGALSEATPPVTANTVDHPGRGGSRLAEIESPGLQLVAEVVSGFGFARARIPV
jgi:hypothetical protein